MNSEDDNVKRGLGADLVIPVAASLYAIYYVGSVWNFPPEAQRSGVALAALLLVLALAFFIRVARQAMSGAQFDFGPLLGPREGRLPRLSFVLLTVLYIPIVAYGGFTLTTFGFLLAGSLLAGLRPLSRALAFAALAALGGWLFFIVLLGTRFPVGPFEALVHVVVTSWN